MLLAGHSYSGVVVAQVADRAPNRVRRSVHVGSFLLRDGRSLIGPGGGGDEARAAECQRILDDGMLWVPPPEALEMVPDLDPKSRCWLAARFLPHRAAVLDRAGPTGPPGHRAAGQRLSMC